MEKLKCAVIGCGGLGHVHMKNLLTMDDVQLTALCDVDETQFTRSVKNNLDRTDTLDLSGVRTYTDAQELLDKEALDFVVIALPTYLHAPYSIMALDKGLHVFCEKPMSTTLEGCRSMVAAAKRNGKLLTVGQVLRFSYPYRLIKEAYETGMYGKLLRLDLRRDSHPPIWGSNNWFMDFDRSGGAVIDLHVHDVDWKHDNHDMPFNRKQDWEAICRALGEIDYQGDFTFECATFQSRFPAPLMEDATVMMAKVGRYLISRVEAYCS